MWHFTLQSSFTKSFRRLDQQTQKRVGSFFAHYASGVSDPLTLPHIKKLAGYSDKYRLRLGEYRIGIQLLPSEKSIAVRFVGARGNFYKNFP